MYYYGMISRGVEWWLFVEILATMVYSTFGIAAVWVALGRRHWFLRTSVAGLVIGMWVLPPAYDNALIGLIQCIFVVVPLSLWRGLQSRTRADGDAPTGWKPYQFTLGSLLLLTVLVAAICALLSHAPKEMWGEWLWGVYYGAGFGMATLLAVRSALGRRVPWIRFLFVCLLLGAWVVLDHRLPRIRHLLAGLLPYAVPMTVWLSIWRRWNSTTQRRARRRWGLALGVATLCIVILPASVWVILLHRVPIPREEVPEPNAYVQLVEAGHTIAAVRPAPPGVTTPATQAQLHAAAEASAPGLADARLVLQEPGRVPIDYGQAAGAAKLPDGPLAMHYLVCALATEGRLAELENRIDDALESYRDLLLLARQGGRGGLPGDLHLRWGIEWGAMRAVDELRDRLDARQCVAWIRLLGQQEYRDESVADTRMRGLANTDWTSPWSERLRLRFTRVMDRLRGERDPLARKHTHYVAARRLLASSLAVRAYCADEEGLPDSLQQLVPKYLPTAPLDPYSHGPLAYRRQGNGYLLYSVGPDGTDDGGTLPLTRPSLWEPGDGTEGDLRLEHLFHEASP